MKTVFTEKIYATTQTHRHKIKSSLKCGLIFLFLYVTMLLII